jgi:hypothetical protein
MALLVLSGLVFGLTLWMKYKADESVGTGLDLKRVSQQDGVMWTTVSGCVISIVNGRLEKFDPDAGAVIVLPCNEYFDLCEEDKKSALGAYVNLCFEGQVEAFTSLVKDECNKKLGAGNAQQKTEEECARSYGTGKCLLLLKPLGRSVPVALVSTATQRAREGLAAKISDLFDGMRELFAKLADAKLNEAVIPVIGAGKGKIDPPLALVGLLLAVAEAARFGQGGQPMKKITIVVFQDANVPPQIAPVVVRRALALIGSLG